MAAFQLIPDDDPKLAIQVKRQLMAFMSYLMFVVPMAYAVAHGWLRFSYAGLAWFVAVAVVINLAFLVAIRSGHTRRFSDPSVMFAQVGCAALLAL
ncbi:MAG: hypothetical protein M3374_03505, partial [Pseudomonadota bacterium]|nr:hypothetical protein [Pseudomonadota bacterium]